MDNWESFLQGVIRASVVAFVKELAKSAYASNREYLDGLIRDILRDDKFAIEIEDSKKSNTGYI